MVDIVGDRVGRLQDLIVGIANHRDTDFYEATGPLRIIFDHFRIEMLAAVEFDRELGADAIKIDDVSEQGVLAAEFKTG
jgi:hypothetical protein